MKEVLKIQNKGVRGGHDTLYCVRAKTHLNDMPVEDKFDVVLALV